jgi:hypothetical protein
MQSGMDVVSEDEVKLKSWEIHEPRAEWVELEGIGSRR